MFIRLTAMQRREISCRLTEEAEDKAENATTNTDLSKCDESMRPPQRQECYNDACKGVWRVGEWSEVSDFRSSPFDKQSILSANLNF